MEFTIGLIAFIIVFLLLQKLLMDKKRKEAAKKKPEEKPPSVFDDIDGSEASTPFHSSFESAEANEAGELFERYNLEVEKKSEAGEETSLLERYSQRPEAPNDDNEQHDGEEHHEDQHENEHSSNFDERKPYNKPVKEDEFDLKSAVINSSILNRKKPTH